VRLRLRTHIILISGAAIEKDSTRSNFQISLSLMRVVAANGKYLRHGGGSKSRVLIRNNEKIEELRLTTSHRAIKLERVDSTSSTGSSARQPLNERNGALSIYLMRAMGTTLSLHGRYFETDGHALHEGLQQFLQSTLEGFDSHSCPAVWRHRGSKQTGTN
jgi:hypothetical protein